MKRPCMHGILVVLCLVLASQSTISARRVLRLRGTNLGEAFYPGNMQAGDYLLSQNGRLLLTLQPEDGNLVLYDTSTSGWTPLWSTGQFSYEEDKWFSLSAHGQMACISNSPGFPNFGYCAFGNFYSTGDFVLVAQNDGNLVLYRGEEAVWASNTFF